MTDYTNTAEQEWEAKLAERVVELLPQVMGWYRVPNAVVTSPEVVELLVESVEKQQAEIELLWDDLRAVDAWLNKVIAKNIKLQAVADAARKMPYCHRSFAVDKALTALKGEEK